MKTHGRLLTASELAAHWGVSRAHVYNLLARGLPSLKVGNCRRFDPEAATAWLEQSQDAA